MTPVNLGTGNRYKMVEVAKMIFKILGWEPKELSFDTSKPTGAVSRALDNTRAKELLGWEPEYDLETTERAIKEAPNIVSGLVVKTFILSNFFLIFILKLISQP